MRVETAPEFEISAKRLERRYRLVHQDVERLTDELEAGVRPQDRRLPNIGAPHVYKARLCNTSARRGASGGFRVVYRVMDDTILLLLIWSKSQISDIPDSEISRIADRY